MPKKRAIEIIPRSRRQASKDALKQMQILLGGDDADNEPTYEIPSGDDDDYVRKVVPVEPPPKKKYKVSHRKSLDDRDVIVLKSIPRSTYVSKDSLELECFSEELSEVQRKRKLAYEQFDEQLGAKLNELLQTKNATLIHQGEVNSIFELNEILSTGGTPMVASGAPSDSGYQFVMDPRLGLIVGTVPAQKGKLQLSSAVKAAATDTSSPPPLVPRTRGRPSKGAKASPAPPTPARSVLQPKSLQSLKKPASIVTSSSSNNVTESTVEGGLGSRAVVDLTTEERNQADNREVSFNKLQGKTYPSLVVVARPHLRVTDISQDRGKLDAKVKTVLMHQPTKFTEWLIQQGLVRSEQRCPYHTANQLKLGMYSDASKFPFSGGYVWISECCPQRFISVFNGSLFEGSPNPPMVMLKLIYHWSCQTNIQNVTQWVKVNNLYVKGVYTWLRAICTIAVNKNIRKIGGPGCRVEVGVISLGTTSHDGNQRQVKVEVLGILETSSKFIRLRAVEPSPDGDRNIKKKFSKILEPIRDWVHPSSIIVTDLTVDKGTLTSMGFNHVVQTTSVDYNNSNRTVMEYLRRIVPRMFQNTLSLLSRQIIQQFLDELVWREWYGTNANQVFENIINDIAELTRLNPQSSLILKLNKVAANPFHNWAAQFRQGTDSVSLAPTTAPAPVESSKRTPRTGKGKVGVATSVTSVGVASPPEPIRPPKSSSPDVPEQMVPLEHYYYGTIEGSVPSSQQHITLNMKCPFCKQTFDNNLLLQNHLFKHAHQVSQDALLCRYCLTSVSTANELSHHVATAHPSDTRHNNAFACLICETSYKNPFILGKHMSREHAPHEMPYCCNSCTFRCSNHKQVIDHFYQKHDGGATIQCPFCLKSTTVWTGGRHISQNINFFVQHLQKHQKKNQAKRCPKCNLWFIQKDVMKEHQIQHHLSLRGRPNLTSWPLPRHSVMVPKSRLDKQPSNAEVINFNSLFYNLKEGMLCKECGLVLSSPKHFPIFSSCQNPTCGYSTCCGSAMSMHTTTCKGIDVDIPSEKLPKQMFCVCGFKSDDGNALAKHLAECEKKSAYPSLKSAKAATVMHSMLDVLGLVRKPEETKTKSADSDVEPRKKSPSPDLVQEIDEISDSNSKSESPETIKEKTRDDVEKDESKEAETAQEIDKDENVPEKHVETSETLEKTDDEEKDVEKKQDADNDQNVEKDDEKDTENIETTETAVENVEKDSENNQTDETAPKSPITPEDAPKSPIPEKSPMDTSEIEPINDNSTEKLPNLDEISDTELPTDTPTQDSTSETPQEEITEAPSTDTAVDTPTEASIDTSTEASMDTPIDVPIETPTTEDIMPVSMETDDV